MLLRGSFYEGRKGEAKRQNGFSLIVKLVQKQNEAPWQDSAFLVSRDLSPNSTAEAESARAPTPPAVPASPGGPRRTAVTCPGGADTPGPPDRSPARVAWADDGPSNAADRKRFDQRYLELFPEQI